MLVWFAWFMFSADPVADDVLDCVASPVPAEMFVGLWVEVPEAVAVCCVGAFWLMVCDCPPPPPLCVAVALCVVLF